MHPIDDRTWPKKGDNQMNGNLLEVGYDKNGEFDFAVTASIVELTDKEYEEFSRTVICAIGIMEDMRRRHFYILPENQASQVSS